MNEVRHLLCLSDFTKDEILALLVRSEEIKKGIPGNLPHRPLEGRSVGMIFEKPSTRTRVSFQVGISQLGGYPIYLNRSDIQVDRGEPIRDTARVLSRYLDALIIRTFGHDVLEEFARWGSLPIINGLSDLHHPCQILGDLLTVREVGLDVTSMKAAWVGDGNNVANSWIEAASILGFQLTLACPEGYEPGVNYKLPNVAMVRDPEEAVKAADVVSTDVWTSMGQEEETLIRASVFHKYQVNYSLLKLAGDNVFCLHCLPAHRGEEITDEVMESGNSLVWDQAENRMHVQKAVLEMLVK